MPRKLLILIVATRAKKAPLPDLGYNLGTETLRRKVCTNSVLAACSLLILRLVLAYYLNVYVCSEGSRCHAENRR